MIRCRFGRDSRLLHPREFEAVMRSRDVQVAIAPFQVLAKHNGLDRPRLGMVVGKRNVPRAVDRNRVRRVIRESFRTRAVALPNADYVVMQRQRVPATDLETLRARIDGAWDRVSAALKARS